MTRLVEIRCNLLGCGAPVVIPAADLSGHAGTCARHRVDRGAGADGLAALLEGIETAARTGLERESRPRRRGERPPAAAALRGVLSLARLALAYRERERERTKEGGEQERDA